MDPKDQARFDQVVKGMSDTLPLMCWSLFSSLKEQGFTEDQAIKLVQSWIQATLGEVRFT